MLGGIFVWLSSLHSLINPYIDPTPTYHRAQSASQARQPPSVACHTAAMSAAAGGGNKRKKRSALSQLASHLEGPKDDMTALLYPVEGTVDYGKLKCVSYVCVLLGLLCGGWGGMTRYMIVAEIVAGVWMCVSMYVCMHAQPAKRGAPADPSFQSTTFFLFLYRALLKSAGGG